MSKANIKDINDSVKTEIVNALNKGNCCEVKKEKNNIVVVEIKRKVRIKNEINTNKA